MENEDSVVDTEDIVAEDDAELTTLSVVEVDVSTDGVVLSVGEAVIDDVLDSDSTEEVAITEAELATCWVVSTEVGFEAEFVVKTEGADSVGAVDSTAVVGCWGVVGTTIVELFICRIKSFIGRTPLLCGPGPVDMRLAAVTRRRIIHDTDRPISNETQSG